MCPSLSNNETRQNDANAQIECLSEWLSRFLSGFVALFIWFALIRTKNKIFHKKLELFSFFPKKDLKTWIGILFCCFQLDLECHVQFAAWFRKASRVCPEARVPRRHQHSLHCNVFNGLFVWHFCFIGFVWPIFTHLDCSKARNRTNSTGAEIPDIERLKKGGANP